MRKVNEFYDSLADFYHLIFEDWDKSIAKQAEIISSLLPAPWEAGTILDCACGIGTQLIGLKQKGFDIEGSDLSNEEVKRAKKEAEFRKLKVPIRVDDMRLLNMAPLNNYGAILLMDNALPHLLSDTDISLAFSAIRDRLTTGGLLILSIRDYDSILKNKPKITDPVFFRKTQESRIIHQVWDWINDREYIVHLYITINTKEGWKAHHFTGHYRGITLSSIQNLMEISGFSNVKILQPNESGFYQPILIGTKGGNLR